MAEIVRDMLEVEAELAEEREAYERHLAEQEAQQEHEYRLAKLKYSTAGRMRMWQKVLLAFAKSPVWIILAFRTKAELPEYWQKFLDS